MSGKLAKFGVTDAEKIAILFEERNLCLRENAESLKAAARTVRPRSQFLIQRFDAESQRLHIELFLRLVIKVDRALGHFRRFCNFIDRGVVKTLPAKYCPGCRKQLV